MNITEQARERSFRKLQPNEFRRHMRVKAEKGNSDKRMDLKEAIARFIKSGDYLSIGGCSIVRIPMAFIHEVYDKVFTSVNYHEFTWRTKSCHVASAWHR